MRFYTTRTEKHSMNRDHQLQEVTRSSSQLSRTTRFPARGQILKLHVRSHRVCWYGVGFQLPRNLPPGEAPFYTGTSTTFTLEAGDALSDLYPFNRTIPPVRFELTLDGS